MASAGHDNMALSMGMHMPDLHLTNKSARTVSNLLKFVTANQRGCKLERS